MTEKQTKRIFWGTFVIGIITFFCPFIAEQIRLEVYWNVTKSFFIVERTINLRILILMLLLLGTFVWLPIMGVTFYRYSTKQCYWNIKQRLMNCFLLGVGSSIYWLPIYVVYTGEDLLTIFEWGYWLLLICTTIMFLCYLNLQKKQLTEDKDLFAHLIEDE
ncbi:hypothetical protein [Aureispira anguillae]|nr:hypothetical protein [Aureispira anguillae]